MPGYGYGMPAVKRHYDLAVEPRQLADPGNAGRLAPTSGEHVLLASGNSGGETRTLGDPLYEGQEFDLFFETDLGAVTITADTGINQAANTSLLFEDEGDHLRLVGARDGAGGRAWRVLVNDGVTLS